LFNYWRRELLDPPALIGTQIAMELVGGSNDRLPLGFNSIQNRLG
jgi:hypothetical protein